MSFLVLKMKRIWGFALFFFGLGMFAMLFIENEFIGIVLIVMCLLVGYYLFCC